MANNSDRRAHSASVRLALVGVNQRPAGDESACEAARSEPTHPKFKALESGNALGEGLTKGIRPIQDVPDRVAF